MKILKNTIITTPSGEPIKDVSTQKELNTANLITICLGQSKYANVADQWRAYEITKKLEDGKNVELEDADYALVKKMVEAFESYRSGFTFMPFLELFR